MDSAVEQNRTIGAASFALTAACSTEEWPWVAPVCFEEKGKLDVEPNSYYKTVFTEIILFKSQS